MALRARNGPSRMCCVEEVPLEMVSGIEVVPGVWVMGCSLVKKQLECLEFLPPVVRLKVFVETAGGC